MKKANVEEIWRRQGWIPPSSEDPEIMRRQAHSRGEFIDLPVLQRIENKNPGDQRKDD